MDLFHHGNWRKVGTLNSDVLARGIYECPLCFAFTRDPMSHADFHVWTGTNHPYSHRKAAS